MKFNLYQIVIRRQSHTVRGHIVAPSQDRAALIFIEHDEALGLTHEDFSLERIDETLGDEHRRGLESLLRSAPAGFASYSEIGWVAPTAPVQQLEFFRTVGDDGDNLYAVAPNIDIAAAIFMSRLSIPKGKGRMLHIYDGKAELNGDMLTSLPRLLELGPVGIAEFDPHERRWLVW